VTSGKTSAANNTPCPVEQMLDIVEHSRQDHRPYGNHRTGAHARDLHQRRVRILRCLAQRGYAEPILRGVTNSARSSSRSACNCRRVSTAPPWAPRLERLCEQSGETVQLYSLQAAKRYCWTA